MQKDYVTLARTNRLIALATLATRKKMVASATNVHQFPVSANRNSRPVPMFISGRAKRNGAQLAA